MADEDGTEHPATDGDEAPPMAAVDGVDDQSDAATAWWSTPRARIAMGVGVVAVLVAVIAASVLRSGGDVTTVEQAGADDRIVTDTAPPDTAATETSGAPVVASEPPSTVGTTTTTRKPRRPGTGPPGPLTAQAVDYPGYERRGALVVKIDNLDSAARPQSGITLADVVYEERVEGNITRFAAVFHGSDSEAVGPIRSGRSTDLGIVGPLQRPLFAFSGANGSFLDLLRAGPLTDIGADVRPGAYYRAPDRGMPHNLFSSTATLYAQAGAAAPTSLWPFRPPNTLPVGARPVVGASMQFGGGFTNVVYRWDPVEGGGAFVREQNGRVHYDTDNWPVAPQNVVIQPVDYVDSGVPDGSGNQIPEGRLVGQGSGWLLTGGAVVPIRWERPSLTQPTQYFGPDGQLVPFAPGKTWIELVPAWAGATFEYR
jgi:hypothetical protein